MSNLYIQIMNCIAVVNFTGEEEIPGVELLEKYFRNCTN